MALPMVVTPVANEGIGAPPDEAVLVAETPDAFARAVLGLLREPARAAAIGRAARRFIVENWSWQKHFDALEAEFVALAADRAAGAPDRGEAALAP